jgi:hypothetical protein
MMASDSLSSYCVLGEFDRNGIDLVLIRFDMSHRFGDPPLNEEIFRVVGQEEADEFLSQYGATLKEKYGESLCFYLMDFRWEEVVDSKADETFEQNVCSRYVIKEGSFHLRRAWDWDDDQWTDGPYLVAVR